MPPPARGLLRKLEVGVGVVTAEGIQQEFSSPR